VAEPLLISRGAQLCSCGAMITREAGPSVEWNELNEPLRSCLVIRCSCVKS